MRGKLEGRDDYLTTLEATDIVVWLLKRIKELTYLPFGINYYVNFSMVNYAPSDQLEEQDDYLTTLEATDIVVWLLSKRIKKLTYHPFGIKYYVNFSMVNYAPSDHC
jgi:hypothetical protein